MKQFKTKENLEKFLESPESEDYREDNFHYLFLDCDNCTNHYSLHAVPYWIEKYNKDDNYQVEYVSGCFESLKIGEKHIIDKIEYEYVDSISLSEEIEHQADDGECVYEYRGFSFLRIWKQNK